jgi:hypothetical protein
MKTLNKKEFKIVSNTFFDRLENAMDNSGCNDLCEDEFPESVINKFENDYEVFEIWKKMIKKYDN